MTAAEKIAAIRQELPATTDKVYLNTGTCGPLPRRSAAVLYAEIDQELKHGRIGRSFERIVAALEEVRSRVATLLGADAAEIALTHHTTDGMNVGTWGLNWRPGDELMTTNLEHEGGLFPAYVAAHRLGLTLRVVDLGLGGDDVVARLERAITPRTRLISLSHVSFTTGARLPLAEIVAMAHHHGLLVLVDGAQSAGAIPVDVHALGADLYAVPGQKWLCGPEGVGALYVRKDRLAEVGVTFAGYLSQVPDGGYDLTGQIKLASSARRYEVGSVFRPGIFAMQESLRWLADEAIVGWDWAFARIDRLAGAAADLLGTLPGVRILTPHDRAGLISFTVEGFDVETVVATLAERGVLIRSIPRLQCLRVSTGFYNTEEDLETLRDALAEIIGS